MIRPTSGTDLNIFEVHIEPIIAVVANNANSHQFKPVPSIMPAPNAPIQDIISKMPSSNDFLPVNLIVLSL